MEVCIIHTVFNAGRRRRKAMYNTALRRLGDHLRPSETFASLIHSYLDIFLLSPRGQILYPQYTLTPLCGKGGQGNGLLKEKKRGKKSPFFFFAAGNLKSIISTDEN